MRCDIVALWYCDNVTLLVARALRVPDNHPLSDIIFDTWDGSVLKIIGYQETWNIGYTRHFGLTWILGYTLFLPVIPERKWGTRPLPDFYFNTLPKPTRYWKEIPPVGPCWWLMGLTNQVSVFCQWVMLRIIWPRTQVGWIDQIFTNW